LVGLDWWAGVMEIVFGIVWFGLLGLAIIWFLHTGGIRKSRILVRIEERFPWLAAYLNFLSFDKWNRVGLQVPSRGGRRFFWFLNLLGVLVLLGLILYSGVKMLQGQSF
jgi:hypothetical protein